MKKSVCASKEHAKEIHVCAENIVNWFRNKEMTHVLKTQQMPRIALRCAQVDDILAYAVQSARYHSPDHAPQLQTILCHGKHELRCSQCGAFFTNRVLEKARKLKIL